MTQRVAHPFTTNWRRSKPTPKHLEDALANYFTTRPSRPTSERYRRALLLTTKMFHLAQKARPFHVNDVIRHYKHPERSPGLPYTKLGYKRKDEVDPNKIKWAVHALKYKIWAKCRTPCNAVGKSAIHATKDKVRLIWVYPAHMTFAEGMFAMPLIRRFQAHMGTYAIWLRYHMGDMRYMMSKKPRSYTWLATDWQQFDASVPAWLIRDAFAILKEQLDFSQYEYMGAPTDPESLPNLWKAIVNYFINTPIRLPDGRISVTSAGIPSGSYFTSLIGSVANCLALHYLLANVSYVQEAFWVLGDDGIVAIKGDVELRELAATALQHLGLHLNVEKTELGEFPPFLGFRMHWTGVPQSDYDRLMAQLCLPSRPDQTQEEFCARIRALQLASFGGNKRFLYETQDYLDQHPVHLRLSKRDELSTKLEALGLQLWTPLSRVLTL